jgi:hypothetical protein
VGSGHDDLADRLGVSLCVPAAVTAAAMASRWSWFVRLGTPASAANKARPWRTHA